MATNVDISKPTVDSDFGTTLVNMDPGLHVKQAINHLNKIIAYYPYVEEDGKALVALTPEDWQVVADAMFYMDTPGEVFPDSISGYSLAESDSAILLSLEDGTEITIEVG